MFSLFCCVDHHDRLISNEKIAKSGITFVSDKYSVVSNRGPPIFENQKTLVKEKDVSLHFVFESLSIYIDDGREEILIIADEKWMEEAMTRFRWACKGIIIFELEEWGVEISDNEGAPRLHNEINKIGKFGREIDVGRDIHIKHLFVSPVLHSPKFIHIKDHNLRHPEEQYLLLLQKILFKKMKGEERIDRTKVGTLSIFGVRMKFDLRGGVLPLFTSKRVWYKGILEELLFFISGKTDTKLLEEKGVNIWKGNSSKKFLEQRGLPYREGDIGPSYGFQWRHWGATYEGCDKNYDGLGIDQLNLIIEGIKKDPFGRRHILSAWNVSDLDKMALPACHCFVQFYVSTDGKYLDCQMTQRSADMFLGVPFNVASYSLLTIIVAKLTGLLPRKLIIIVGDAHVYLNHIEAVRTQLSRKLIHPFPILKIKEGDFKSLDDFTFDSFSLEEYQSWPPIRADMAV